MDIDISKLILDAFFEAGWFSPLWFLIAVSYAVVGTLQKRFPLIAVILLVFTLALDLPQLLETWIHMGLILLLFLSVKKWFF